MKAGSSRAHYRWIVLTLPGTTPKAFKLDNHGNLEKNENGFIQPVSLNGFQPEYSYQNSQRHESAIFPEFPHNEQNSFESPADLTPIDNSDEFQLVIHGNDTNSDENSPDNFCFKPM